MISPIHHWDLPTLLGFLLQIIPGKLWHLNFIKLDLNIELEYWVHVSVNQPNKKLEPPLAIWANITPDF